MQPHMQLWSSLDPRDGGPPGSSVHGIPQARILECVAMPSSRGSFWLQWSNLRLLCLLCLQAGSLPLAPCGKPHLIRRSEQFFLRLCRTDSWSPECLPLLKWIVLRALKWVRSSACFCENYWRPLGPSLPVFSSVQFSHSVVSDSLRAHEPQHARPPCPSPTPGVYSPYP